MKFLKLQKYNVTVELKEPLLGTVPRQDVHTAHVQRKQRERLEKMARDNVPLSGGGDVTSHSIASVLEEEALTAPSAEEIEKAGYTT